MDESNDPISPEASSGKSSDALGVRRINNRPLYIALTVCALFLLVMMMVMIDRANEEKHASKKESNNGGSASLFADMIAGNKTHGFIPPAESKPALPSEQHRVVAPQLPNKSDVMSSHAALPQQQSSETQQMHNEEMQNIYREKEQMLQAAVKAKTSVQIASQNSINTNQQIGGQSASINNSQSTSDNQGDRWQLDTHMKSPNSPYELLAGSIIPATLISGIISELSGQVEAQVSQDVFNTATGRYLLIPQGSRLIGQYSNQIIYGQSRVLVVWQRINFPDGKTLDIGSMPGADGAGNSGFHDMVNNHYLRIFGSALLLSTVVAGITMSQDNNNDDNNGSYNQRAGDAMSEALGQVFGQVVADMIRRNMNIAPTITIRPGYRFNVIVTKDMTFKTPYKAFSYE